ncbi:hypothetical protein PTKIN_Ptkin14bG0076900 [Pterospermum kingtungense]
MCNRTSMDHLSYFIESLDLVDFPLTGGRFTWCSNEEQAMFHRLDHFCCVLDSFLSSLHCSRNFVPTPYRIIIWLRFVSKTFYRRGKNQLKLIFSLLIYSMEIQCLYVEFVIHLAEHSR